MDIDQATAADRAVTTAATPRRLRFLVAALALVITQLTVVAQPAAAGPRTSVLTDFYVYPLSCSLRGQLKSAGSRTTHITFTSERTDSVQLFWIDGEGQLSGYGWLAPGATKGFTVYTDQFWEIVDNKGMCVYIYATQPYPSLAVIL